LYDFDGGTSFGSSQTVYLSLPDTSSTCGSWSLPPLPSGWSYQCVASSTLTKVDGTGWLPVDFSSIIGGSPLSVLPIDPVNASSSDNYYTYVKGGSWELTSYPESKKYLLLASQDGGDSVKYEAGTNKSLNPFKNSYSFDDFLTTSSNDRSPRWWKYVGTGSVSLDTDSGGTYLRANGDVWYEWQENIPFNPNVLYKISCKVRQVSDPTSGNKKIFCGVAGVAANGTTMINVDGVDSYSSQHYFAASGQALTAGAGYTTYTGYFKGTGTSAGGQRWDSNNPGEMRNGVTYFRPLFVLNYDGGNGVANIEMEVVEIIDQS
ncbi:MAG: hypothetical protein WD889_00330, partial [Candidatus Colwellbacteria bacterium]